MSTTTSNLGLIKPELTDAADITAMNVNWDKIDEQITLLASDISGKSKTVTATLLATSWQSNTYTWRNAEIVSATQLIELLPSQSITVEQLEALQSANIVGISQAVGNVTFKAYGDVPTIDIPVIFIIRGDA